MSELRDKTRNATQGAKGKAKGAVGRATGNNKLRAKGAGDRAKAGTKKFGERIKDVFR